MLTIKQPLRIGELNMDNKKPKHFIVFKIIGFIGIIAAIVGFVLSLQEIVGRESF